MSQAIFEVKAHAGLLRAQDRRIAAPALAVLAVAAAAVLSGCANRDSVVVGSVPDDYRITNTSERVVGLILGTAKLSNAWDGIRANDLTR